MSVVQQAFASSASTSAHSSVSIFIVSPSTHSERAFSTATTIGMLKSRLESVTGIGAASQVLSLHEATAGGNGYEAGSQLASLGEDARTLADYGITRDDYIIKVSTTDHAARSQLFSHVEDPNVQKFELTDDEYAKRNDTVMAYKARNKIGRFSDSPAHDVPADSLSVGLVPGARVIVDLSSSGVYLRPGTIRSVGATEFAKGTWVGVEYDEPVGKNDGAVEGVRYFSCRLRYGGFVRPEKCRTASAAEGERETNTDEELELSD